jgi:hypothetical protein
MSEFDDSLAVEMDGLPDHDLLEEIKELIRYASSNAKRSL